MIRGLKYHVEYTHGSKAETYSGFFIGVQGSGHDEMLVFENRTTAYTEEKRIAGRCIVATTCYNERAPWAPPEAGEAVALPPPDPSVNARPMGKT